MRFFSPQRKPYIALERAPLAALNRPGTSPACGLISPSNKARFRPYIALEQAPKPPLWPYIALKQAPDIALEQAPLAALYRP